jgi:hypothetical protein
LILGARAFARRVGAKRFEPLTFLLFDGELFELNCGRVRKPHDVVVEARLDGGIGGGRMDLPIEDVSLRRRLEENWGRHASPGRVRCKSLDRSHNSLEQVPPRNRAAHNYRLSYSSVPDRRRGVRLERDSVCLPNR